MNIVERNYRDRCSEIEVTPNLEIYRKADELARAYIMEMTRTLDMKEQSPVIIIKLHDGLHYFIKVVEDTAYPSILMEDELGTLGYNMDNITGG